MPAHRTSWYSPSPKRQLGFSAQLRSTVALLPFLRWWSASRHDDSCSPYGSRMRVSSHTVVLAASAVSCLRFPPPRGAIARSLACSCLLVANG